MVRNGLLALLCAGLLTGLVFVAGPARGEDTENRLRTQLAVQSALQQGRDELQRGNYAAAVACLEKEIARVDGNRDYINALREAYRGYIHELHQAHRSAEARPYQERLRILDPGYHLEMNASRTSSAPTISTLASQTSPPSPSAAKPKLPTPSAPTKAYTARPQMPDEPDPFSDSNSVPSPSAADLPPSKAGDLLSRAKQEFDHKDYLAANHLYEEANRLDTHALAPYRELWAFCKLCCATDAVNKAGWAPPADADKEVLAALALTTSPQLQRQGKEILRTIQERRIEIRHTPAQEGKWAEAESPNFCVVHMQSRDLAEQVARVAETTRSAMIRKWFGEEPTAWERKCRIILYATAEHYARGSHQSVASPGHSTMQSEPGNPERVVFRRIELHCDVAEMLTHVLPHETTHAVLAGRFGRHHVPRWADEGIAVLTEPREKVDRYLRNLAAHRSRHELFPVGKLMGLDEYPEGRLVTPFYVQSISLVEFLSTQKGGPQEFTRFVRDGLEGGYEAALRRHYGIQDFNDLEQRWTKATLGESSGVAAVYPPQR
jgi:hypothetical protein